MTFTIIVVNIHFQHILTNKEINYIKKRLFLVFLLSVIAFSASSFDSSAALADSLDLSAEENVIYHLTEEEIEAEHKRQAEQELNRLIELDSKNHGEVTPLK